jgi:hypothetical protein
MTVREDNRDVRTLAAACHRHRLVVVLGWLGLLVATLLAARATGERFATNISMPRTDSGAAYAPSTRSCSGRRPAA